METVVTRCRLAECLQGVDRAEIGFVPTMGALHQGHMSLVRQARKENRVVVVSVFVNPTQFNDPNDLHSYPRTPEADLEMLRAEGADIVFMPATEEIYPEPDNRVFDFGNIDKVMEGATRPGHFNGVAQVVSRLFNLVNPARAYFGQKDFQQVAIIKAMVAQQGFDIEIRVCPTVREQDGLAMSSRNTLLDSEHREAAPKIYQAMQQGVIKAGEGMSPQEVERFVTEQINSEGILEVIYFKIVNSETLDPALSWDEQGGIQGCVAVRAGSVRLIDNISFV